MVSMPIVFILGTLYLYTPDRIAERQARLYSESTQIRVTCYTATGNPMASGKMPYEGACAGRTEDRGKSAYVFTTDGEYVGRFLIEDCGGAYSLQNGTSIDIYRDTLQGCYEWIECYGDYMNVVIK